MASTPPNSATPNGWCRCRPTASRLPVDSAAAAQQLRDSQRTALHRPTVLHPPLSGCCRHYPAALRPPADVGIIVAGCTRGASIRATGALRLAVALPNRALLAARQTARGVFPSASGHGNISPSCIPREASDRKKDTSRQYIAAMYSNNANHGKNRSPCIRFAVQNAVREYIERKTCRQGALFSSGAPKSCIARISCHPRRPVPPRYRYSPYRTRFLATPSPPVLALQPRSLPQLPRYRRLASRSFCALCCLFSLTVRRSFRALSRLVGLQLPQLPRRYRDSCVVAGAGNVQRPFVGVG